MIGSIFLGLSVAPAVEPRAATDASEALARLPHVYGFTMRLVDAAHIALEFVFQSNSKKSVERIELTRVGRRT